MKRPLVFKFLAIAFLMLFLLIPLGMIGNSIDERRAYSEAISVTNISSVNLV